VNLALAVAVTAEVNNHMDEMYGPPRDCKRIVDRRKKVCANVCGLLWSGSS
jgi:hypothetical protein